MMTDERSTKSLVGRQCCNDGCFCENGCLYIYINPAVDDADDDGLMIMMMMIMMLFEDV